MDEPILQKPDLQFDPRVRLVKLMTGGEIDVLDLYREIRSWEASEQ